MTACTCHPDDNPPVPCPQRFALLECRLASAEARLREADAVIRACPPTSNPALSAQEHLARVDAWWRSYARPYLRNQLPKKGPPIQSFILIDMSGSMEPKWDETKIAVNSFVQTVAKEDPGREVAVFGFTGVNNGLNWIVIRHPVRADDFKRLDANTPAPNGFTPLFDALGTLDAKMPEGGKVTVMVVTDGQENASREIGAVGAKALIAKWQSREWDVVFLGADWNAFSQAADLGLKTKDVLNASQGNYGSAMRAAAGRTMAYAGGQSISDLDFSDKDRHDAGGPVS